MSNHVAQDGSHGVKSLVRGTDVVESIVIEQDLLHDENGHSLAKLRASLHDAEAQRYYLCGKEEVDDVGGVILDQGANDAKARESQIFKGSRL